jgi:Circadian oscillating protein COP23
MKSFFLPALILATGLITGFPAISSAQPAPDNPTGTVQFSCGTAKDASSRSELPATVATVSGSDETTTMIIWKSEYFGTKYTPQERCSIVSTAMQKAFQEGRTAIGSGVDKKTGLGIICGVSKLDQPCDSTNMLLTMKSYQVADETVDQLGSIMQGKTGKPVYQSSGGKRVDLRDLLLKRRAN